MLGPFVVLLGQDGADQANDGVPVREDSHDVGTPADLAVQPLDRVQALHRRDMFASKMAEAGLEPVATISTRYAPHSAALHTDQLLELTTTPTAIVYGSDPMALGGIRAAHRHGMSVPEQLPVVGFDDLQLSEWSSPPLSTVHRDVPQRGRAVATLLLRALGHDLETLDVGQPFLVVRDSTAPPR